MPEGTVEVEVQGARGMLTRAAYVAADSLGTVLPGPADVRGEYTRGICLLGCSCFHGPVAGLVSVAAPLNLCEALVAGILDGGTPCDDAELVARSVLGELANMIASQVALQLEPAEPVTMTPPTVERSTYADWITLDGSRDVVRLNVDGWPLLAMLSLRAA